MPYTITLVAIVAGYIWIVDRFVDVRGPWRAAPVVLALGVGIVKAVRTGEWGLARRALAPAAGWTVVFTALAGAVLWWAGMRAGSWHPRPGVGLDFLYLIFWGGGQQFLLQTVVFREARHRLPAAGAVVLAAAIFAGLHLPNPFLTIVTALGALGWCSVYGRAPNVIPLAISHAVLTLVVLHAFDDGTTGHLRTGWRYLQ